MTVETMKEAHADSKNGMRLDELAAFVQDAMRSGADGQEVVQASVSWGSKLKSVKIHISANAKPED